MLKSNHIVSHKPESFSHLKNLSMLKFGYSVLNTETGFSHLKNLSMLKSIA